MRFGLNELVLILCLVTLLFGPAIYNRVKRFRRFYKKKSNAKLSAAAAREAALKKQRETRNAKIKILCFSVFGALFLCIGVYLAFWPLRYPAQSYTLKNDKQDGTQLLYQKNTTLDRPSGTITLREYSGISALKAHEDWLYVITAGGKLIRVREDGTGLTELLSTNGEILAFDFDSDNNIIFADACYEGGAAGLYKAAFDGFAVTVTPLLSAAQQAQMTFPTDVRVASDGKIYVTNASKIPSDTVGAGTALRTELLSHTKSGTLYCFNPETSTLSSLVRDIPVATSLALSPDEKTIYLSAYASCEIWAIDTTVTDITLGESGTEPIYNALPGYPGTLQVGEDGIIYASLTTARASWRESLSEKASLRNILLRLPVGTQEWLVSFSGNGHLFAFTPDGEIIADYQTGKANKDLPITTMCTMNDQLYIGQAGGNTISSYALPLEAPSTL